MLNFKSFLYRLFLKINQPANPKMTMDKDTYAKITLVKANKENMKEESKRSFLEFDLMNLFI